MSHIIHMYRPFLNGCSFDVMTHIWLKIKRRLSFGFGFDSPNKFDVHAAHTGKPSMRL